MNNFIYSIFNWIQNDWYSNKLRFFIEIFAWACSVGCALVFALTVPNPPLFWLYPFWIGGCLMYTWAAWTRKSVGMLANYLLLTTIDTIGLVRLLLN
jgi:hypothetical protein